MDNISKARYEKTRKEYERVKETVAWAQEKLNGQGYGLKVDGIWGSKTEGAVRAFQKSKGLKVDGIVGRETKKALEAIEDGKILHFRDAEFKCKCPGWCEGLPSKGISRNFLLKLEKVRSEVNRLFPRPDGKERVVNIRSGYRCEKWNPKVGGAKKSQHMVSNPLAAADIWVPGVSPKSLGEICDRIFHNGGVGLGGATIVHVDCRGYRSRWRYD